MDIFIEKYKWIIISGLAIIIIAGTSIIVWDRGHRNKINSENKEISELRVQNEMLRQQLSLGSSKNVAGVNTNLEDESGKLNINSASEADLDKLPGIGPARAADIIAYRQENGGFSSIEELKNISGIGDKTFENLKDLVTVGNISDANNE